MPCVNINVGKTMVFLSIVFITDTHCATYSIVITTLYCYPYMSVAVTGVALVLGLCLLTRVEEKAGGR